MHAWHGSGLYSASGGDQVLKDVLAWPIMPHACLSPVVTLPAGAGSGLGGASAGAGGDQLL
jgi:hypothetical protein